MKKTFLLLSLLFVTLSVFSQKCKFEKNEIDEFTGKKVLKTLVYNIHPKTLISQKYLIWIGFTQINEDFYLNVVLNSLESAFVDVGDNFYFKLKDNTITKMESTSLQTDTNVSLNPLTKETNYSIIVTYPTTKEQLQEIFQKGILKVRMETTDGYYEQEVSKKGEKNLIDGLNCFLLETNK